MILYGWKTTTVPLAELGTLPCTRCGTSRPFHALLRYKEFHLYWIFGIVTSRKLLAACAVCNQGTAMEKQMLPPTVDQDPVPFMQKWGLGVFLGIVALIIAVAAIRH
ncbi:MAG: hypothetical protein ABSC76_14635 [Terracidiphilus sp.]